MAFRIVIRHVSAPKANEIEQFPLDGYSELTIGRDPNSTILFDAQRDDFVSRQHAVIRITGGEQPTFKIADRGSRNGTRLNGEAISGEVELLPGDTVELGAGGPKFTFDVHPRPANLAFRTRALPKAMGETRILSTADIAAAAKAAPPAPAGGSGNLPGNPASAEMAKPSVGRATVIGMLAEQRTRTNRTWMYVAAAALLVVAVGGGALYYDNKLKAEAAAVALAEQQRRLAAQQEAAEKAKAEQAAALEKSQREAAAALEKSRREAAAALERSQREAAVALEKAQQESAASLQKAVGMTPQEIVRKYGDSTVLIEASWRLYHQGSGKVLYQKMITQPDRSRLPAYVQLANNQIVRWLTTDDENQTNRVIGMDVLGTGFVISNTGFILTNKHVVAGWMTTVYSQRERSLGDDVRGVLYDITQRRGPRYFIPAEHPELASWTPLRGPVVFRGNAPIPVEEDRPRFEGRIDHLLVKFPGNHTGLAARFIRASVEADVAEIKVDAEQPLTPVELSSGALAPVGEPVTVLGYPSFSTKTLALVRSNEGLRTKQSVESIPEPTVTAGNISRMSEASQSTGSVTTVSTMGELYQLTVPTGAGNSGGPVFDQQGKVIGIFTAGLPYRETTTFAVPIKYGIELFKVQRSAQ
jgi:serine protease Do